MGRSPVPKQEETPEKLLEEIRKPSKGEELIKSLQENVQEKNVVPNSDDVSSDPNASNEPQDNTFAGTIKDGVEVVDVKVIPKKTGIPFGNRKTWDKL